MASETEITVRRWMLAHVRMLRGECQRDASRVKELAAASEALESLGEMEVNLQIALAACADLRRQLDAARGGSGDYGRS